MPVLITLFWLWSRGEEMNWLLGMLALLNIVLVHAAGNVWSDIYDYRCGVDASDTYGIRLLVDGNFNVSEFRRLSVMLNVLAVLLGLLMVGLTGPTLLCIGIAGILLSLSYPRLKYMALGDVVIILCYALLPMLGTSYIATGRLVWNALWLAVPVGLITVAILHANNVRDIETDHRAGIRTFPMLTGRTFGVWLYAFEVFFPYLWLVYLVVMRVATGWLLMGLLAIPMAVANVQTIWGNHKQPSAYSNLDEKTAQLQLLFSLLLIAGLSLSVVC